MNRVKLRFGPEEVTGLVFSEFRGETKWRAVRPFWGDWGPQAAWEWAKVMTEVYPPSRQRGNSL